MNEQILIQLYESRNHPSYILVSHHIAYTLPTHRGRLKCEKREIVFHHDLIIEILLLG